MSYIDTCCLMMFINRKDELRKDYGLKGRDAETCTNNSHRHFTIPIPALGEAVFKIREKNSDNWKESLDELDRLINIGFLDVVYLDKSTELYRVTRKLCRDVDDVRDMISPMDALIVAAATVNPDCGALYTSDRRILVDVYLNESVQEWRKEHGYPALRIAEISSILKNKKQYW